MLKFLDERPEDRSPKRSPIKYKPEMLYGNSYQSPSQFQTPHTIYQKSSYVNPFLPFEKKRAQEIPKEQKSSLEPLWTQKTNLTLVQEHKILADSEKQPPRSRYLQSFYKQFQDNPKRFRITRGQFTNFIEKNNHYKPMGPMQGIERTEQRIQDRTKSVWIKPLSKKQEMTSSLKFASCLDTTIKSSIVENSEMLLEKNRIRRNRDHIRKSFWKDLEQRKKLTTSQQFSLPKKGPGHELYLIDRDFHGKERRSNPSKQVQNMEQLDFFQGKLNRTFK